MKVLIDTNILFYAIDSSDRRKHEIAKEIVKTAFREEAYISAQNIAEFYHQVKRKLKLEQINAAKTVAMAIIKSKNWIKISYDAHTIWNVINKENGKDFWDLVIYFTMLENGIEKIITENERDFKELSGIEVKNPF